MNNDNFDLKSVYNEGYLQIQRLNYSWIRCNRFSVNGQFKEWRWELDVILRELANDMFLLKKAQSVKDFDKLEEIKYFYELNNGYASAMKLGDRDGAYKSLHMMEIVLRITQHQAGKGSKYVDQFEDGIDE